MSVKEMGLQRIDAKEKQEIKKTMKLKTISVKNKPYVEVNTRISAFWDLYPNGRISTEIVSVQNGVCIMRASVYTDKFDETPTTTGTAYEVEGSTNVNSTSFIENAETSCIGRALGIMGIGIDNSIASADEVTNAIAGQTKIDEIKVASLERAINNYSIDATDVDAILSKYGYKNLSDIQVINYIKICKELEKLKGA